MDNKLYKLMDWPAIEEIVYSECSHPKKILGGHRVKEGFLIQVFRPNAVSVSVSVSERKRAVQMEKVDDAGFFAALIPLKKSVKYTLNIEDRNGHVKNQADPYAFEEFDSSRILFNKFLSGTEYKAYTLLGSRQCVKDGVEGVLFRTWSPNAMRVSVVGEFNNWDGRICQMEKIMEEGIYELFIPHLTAGTEYMYEVKFNGSNTALKLDPYALEATSYADAHSVVSDMSLEAESKKQSVMKDSKWLEQRKKYKHNKPLSILEIDLKNVAEMIGANANYISMAEWIIDYVKKTGYTHIQLMSDSSIFTKKGYCYAASCYYVPSVKYGSTQDYKKMISALHNEGIGVILEWNGAYFGTDLRGLVNYDGGNCYGYLRPVLDKAPDKEVTTFAYEKGEVRSFLISNLAMWFDEYHIDGIKLTDTSTMLYLDYGKKPGEWTPNMYGGNENLDAIEFLKQMNGYIHSRKDGIISIAEETSMWSGVTDEEGEKSLDFDYKLNDGLAEEFREFIKQDPLFRKGMYNRLTYEMFYHYKECFMTSLSYSELKGTSLYELAAGNNVTSRLADVRAALGYIYTYPGTKLISLGNDTASLLSAEDMNGKYGELSDKEYKDMLEYVNALNNIYKNESTLYELNDEPEGFNWVDNYNAAETVLAYERIDKAGNRLLVAVNFTPVIREGYMLNVSESGKYVQIFNSENAPYEVTKDNSICYSGADADDNGKYKLEISIPPSSVVIYRYKSYTDVELKEIQIINAAKTAKIEAEKKVQLAKQLADMADEEAKKAADAEKAAKESLRLAKKARDEAEQKAMEAVEESLKIDEEMKRKLYELKNNK